MSEKKEDSGKLFIVSTPIGNKDDFTIRAISVLKLCDVVVCEELKMGATILKQINLKKDLIPLNEQNEAQTYHEVLDLVKSGKKVALISDCGTPVFADPGSILVRHAIERNLPIEVVPGVNSIMTAIVRSGFELREFLFAGFLPRVEEARANKFKHLSRETRTFVILDTPYRLKQLLQSAASVIPDRRAYLGLNLTMHYETHHYGTLSELNEKFLKEEGLRAEFVLVIEGISYTEAREQAEKRREIREKRAKEFSSSESDGGFDKPRSGRKEGTGQEYRPKRDDYGSDKREYHPRRDDSGGDRKNYRSKQADSEGGKREYRPKRDDSGEFKSERKGRNFSSGSGNFRKKDGSGAGKSFRSSDKPGGFKKSSGGPKRDNFRKKR